MKTISKDIILKNFIKQASARKIHDEEGLHKLKKSLSKEFVIPLPRNLELQKSYKELLEDGWSGDIELQKILRKRKVRTLSGVSVITVLTKPYPCPGKCVFCPSEPAMPKSYLSNEPGAMRAVLDDFHPRDQVRTRIRSLGEQGHETDKIEMIVLGGTFSAYNRQYQTNFIKALFNACNEKNGKSLNEAQKINESAGNRIIGLSLETRPDHISEREIKNMRRLGCTKIQIGVQHTDNTVLAINKRGETIEDSMRAIKLMKDAGLKIATHIMPNLPGSTPQKDVEMLTDFWSMPELRPDHIKIYPCIVTPYSELEKWYNDGKFRPYTDKELVKILLEIKKTIPEYVRIERLFRDIPGESIISGSKKTNMRQLLHDMMIKNNVKCRCIRCREIKDGMYEAKNIEKKIVEYDASDGKEFFLSYNDVSKDKLCSLLRLRFHSYGLQGKKHYISELEGAALVREIHTYGAQISIGENKKNASQHIGLGRKLLEEAEKLSKRGGYRKIAVIAGVGTRNYYRKWGYELEGTYMTKKI